MRVSNVQVLGRRVRVLEEGTGEGRDPVLMIHGVGGWAENWLEVMEPIARGGRRAIAVDLPGFGESEAPGRVSHFGPRDAHYAKFVGALLDELGVRSAHVVGNSMGGAVAYVFAVSQPERVSSLTLVASGGLGTEIAPFLRLATLPGFVLLSRAFGSPARARQVLATCFHDARRIPAHMVAEVERYGLRSFPEFVRALRSGVWIFGLKRHVRAHWMGQASRYGGPVLVIWGRQDAVLPMMHLDDVGSVFPRAEVRVVEECGHLPMAERPDEFLSALLPFLDRAEAAAAA